MGRARLSARPLIGVALAAIAAPTAVGAAAPASTEPAGGECTYAAGIEGTPVHGDTLTFVSPVPATSLNPATANTAFAFYTSLAYESLTYRAADGTIEPALAESWQYVGDTNQQLDITLRSGVTFADGSPVDAAAVVASLEYQRATNTASPYLDDFDTIEATGDLTLTITTKQPNPMLPDLLTPKHGIGQIISPAGLADPDLLTVEHESQGAGPYTLDPGASVAGDHYTYTANPDYYDPCRQHYDQVVIQVIPDGQAALNALQAGQVDIMTGDLGTFTQAVDAGLQVVKTPLTWVGLNLIDRGGQVSEPLGDVRVRQAINHAIDRDTITAALLGEFGTPTSMITMPEGEGWSAETAGRYAYDPDTARELLTEAGYPDGFELDVLSVRFQGMDILAEAIAGQLAEVGITLNLTHAEDEQTYVNGAMGQEYPAFMAVYGVQPMFIMGPGLFLTESAMFNGFHTDSAELRELYDAFAVAPIEDQPALAVQIQDYLASEAWFAPVVLTPFTVYARTDLGGVHLSPGAPTPDPLDWYDVEA